MIRFALAALVAVGLTALVHGQDAVTTLPGSYALQFENEWVRVVRVRYAPFAKLPGHTHTALASAYVYLSDGGPVVFKHVGKEYGAVTRPATVAGSFRLYEGIDEIHEVENTSPLSSEFLRVELKTDPRDVRTLRGKFFREPLAAGEPVARVQFENDQVRISRLTIPPSSGLDVATTPAAPSLLVALSASRFSVTRGSTGAALALRPGDERWLAVNQRERLDNVGSTPGELLRFDLKTSPLP